MLRFLSLIALCIFFFFNTAQAKMSMGTIGDCTPAERKKFKNDFPNDANTDCGFFCVKNDGKSERCYMNPTSRAALLQRGEISNIMKNLSDSDAAAVLESSRSAETFSDFYKAMQNFGPKACAGAADTLLTARQAVMDAEKSLSKLNKSFSCDKATGKGSNAQ